MFACVSKFFSLSKWCSSSPNTYRFRRLWSRLHFWRHRSLTLNRGDLNYTVTYLGNVPTCWAKGDATIETPLNILWRNYQRKKGKKAQTKMKVTLCNTGLQVSTRELGTVEYWSNRISYVTSLPTHPQVFLWVYRHTGKRGKPELRCHAVLCKNARDATAIADELRVRLYNALREFRRELNLRQNAPNNRLPARKQFLVRGAQYFKQPLERSQSAPKLDSIVEEDSDDDLSSTASNTFMGNGRQKPLYFVSTGQLNF